MSEAVDSIKTGFKLAEDNYSYILNALFVVFILALSNFAISNTVNFMFSNKIIGFSLFDMPKLGSSDLFGLRSRLFQDLTQPSVVLNQVIGYFFSMLKFIVLFALIVFLNDRAFIGEQNLWILNIRPQTGNAIKYSFIYLVQEFLHNLPFILALAYDLFWDNVFSVFLLGIISCAVVLMIYCIFILSVSFVPVELALGGRGFFSAIKASAHLVHRNILEVLFFHMLWFCLYILASFIGLITCCGAFLVFPFISIFVLIPVRLFSEICFWRKLNESRILKSEGSTIIS